MSLNLDKEFARLAAIAEKQEAIRTGKKPMSRGGVKTHLTEIERAQKKAAKIRKDFVKDVQAAKKEVLSEEVEDYSRMMELIPLTETGIEQAQEVLQTYDSEMAKLEAAIYLLQKKKEAAENDVDLLRDALDSLEAFNEAVNQYALSCIENSEEFDPDDILDLWENMMPQEHLDALNRGTTVFNSLDYHMGTTQGEFSKDPRAAMKSLQMKIERLFHKYDITGPRNVPSEDI